MNTETGELYSMFKLQLGMTLMRIESNETIDVLTHLGYTGDFRKLYPEGMKDEEFFRDSLIWMVNFYLETDNLLDIRSRGNRNDTWTSEPVTRTRFQVDKDHSSKIYNYISSRGIGYLNNTHLTAVEVERDLTISLMMRSIEYHDPVKILEMTKTAKAVMKSERLYKNTKKLKSLLC